MCKLCRSLTLLSCIPIHIILVSFAKILTPYIQSHFLLIEEYLGYIFLFTYRWKLTWCSLYGSKPEGCFACGFLKFIGLFLYTFNVNKYNKQTHTYPTQYLSPQKILLAKQSHCKQRLTVSSTVTGRPMKWHLCCRGFSNLNSNTDC